MRKGYSPKKPSKLSDAGQRKISANIYDNVERQGDNYASKNDINSLRNAFAAYFSASTGYHIIGDKTAYERTIKKGNEVSSKIAKETGTTREEVATGILEGMIKDLGKKHSRKHKGPIVAFIGLAGIISGLFFISANLTGQVISLTATPSNWIGAMLFIVGLIGLGVYFRRK